MWRAKETAEHTRTDSSCTRSGGLTSVGHVLPHQRKTPVTVATRTDRPLTLRRCWRRWEPESRRCKHRHITAAQLQRRAQSCKVHLRPIASRLRWRDRFGVRAVEGFYRPVRNLSRTMEQSGLMSGTFDTKNFCSFPVFKNFWPSCRS